MRTASAAPDFGFWILDFGLGSTPEVIQNPKLPIQNGDGYLSPDTARRGQQAPGATRREGKEGRQSRQKATGAPQGTPSKEHSHPILPAAVQSVKGSTE